MELLQVLPKFVWNLERRPSLQRSGDGRHIDLSFSYIYRQRDHVFLVSLQHPAVPQIEDDHRDDSGPFIAVEERMVTYQRVHESRSLSVDIGIGIFTRNGRLWPEYGGL